MIGRVSGATNTPWLQRWHRAGERAAATRVFRTLSGVVGRDPRWAIAIALVEAGVPLEREQLLAMHQHERIHLTLGNEPGGQHGFAAVIHIGNGALLVAHGQRSGA